MNDEMKATIESAVRLIAQPKHFEGITDLADYCGEALAHISRLLKVIENQQAAIEAAQVQLAKLTVELANANAAIEATGAGVREEMVYCNYCRFPTIHYDDICRKCGHPLFEK